MKIESKREKKQNYELYSSYTHLDLGTSPHINVCFQQQDHTVTGPRIKLLLTYRYILAVLNLLHIRAGRPILPVPSLGRSRTMMTIESEREKS